MSKFEVRERVSSNETYQLRSITEASCFARLDLPFFMLHLNPRVSLFCCAAALLQPQVRDWHRQGYLDEKTFDGMLQMVCRLF